jgi:O-antigen/teichoic acid export membrane protein
MSSDAKKFIKGVTSGYAFTLFSILVSLWMVPFVLKYLTKSEYGIFAIASDLLGWLSIANLGITSTLNSQAAQLIGNKDYKKLSSTASTAFFSQLISGILIILIGIYLAFKPHLLFGKTEGIEYVVIVVALVILSYLVSYVTQPLNSLLVADKQIHVDNYLRFGLLILRTTITIILLMSGFKLLSLAISNLVATIVISMITWFRFHKSLQFIEIKWKLWNINIFKFLLKNGIWFTIGGIAGILILRTDAYLIGKYISLVMVSNFVINIKMYQLADSIHGQFFNNMRPYYAQLYGRKEMTKLTSLYNLTFFSSFGLALLMGVGIFIVNKWFISHWVGNDFYLGDTVNMLLAINFVIQAAVLPNRILLATSLYKINFHNLTRIFEGIFNFGFSFLLIQYYGIWVIIVASIITSLVFSNIFLNYLSGKLLKTKILSHFFVYLILLVPFIVLNINNIYIRDGILLFFVLFTVVFLYKHVKKDFFIFEPILLKYSKFIPNFLK